MSAGPSITLTSYSARRYGSPVWYQREFSFLADSVQHPSYRFQSGRGWWFRLGLVQPFPGVCKTHRIVSPCLRLLGRRLGSLVDLMIGVLHLFSVVLWSIFLRNFCTIGASSETEWPLKSASSAPHYPSFGKDESTCTMNQEIWFEAHVFRSYGQT